MYEYRATVISVTDGDTVRLDIDLGFSVILNNTPIRLIGIDAPEIRTLAGRGARTYLRSLLPKGTVITLQTYKDKTEKYGRILGTLVTENGVNLNLEMVNSGHAVPYLVIR